MCADEGNAESPRVVTEGNEPTVLPDFDQPLILRWQIGTQFVGAIHGRLLTAWSTAGIIGPVVVNYIRESEIAAGVPRAFEDRDFAVVTLGYLVMRIALVTQWLRASRGDPPRRATHMQVAPRRSTL